MNVSPMDMQVIIPKATEVGKGQQQRDHQNVLQQEFGAAQFQRESDRKPRQVQHTEKQQPEKKIKEDGQRRGGGGAQSGEQRDGSEPDGHKEEIRMAVDVVRGRNIDIKM